MLEGGSEKSAEPVRSENAGSGGLAKPTAAAMELVRTGGDGQVDLASDVLTQLEFEPTLV